MTEKSGLHFTQAEWDLAIQIVEAIEQQASDPWDQNVAVDVTISVLVARRGVLQATNWPFSPGQ